MRFASIQAATFWIDPVFTGMPNLPTNHSGLNAMNNPQRNTYSFRAEYQHDFDEFVREFVHRGHSLSIKQARPNIIETVSVPEFDTGEVLVEFSCELDQGRVEEIIRSMPDSHVMLQSLRPVPLSENSTERDYTKE
jgi:hypothetical protein